MDVELSAHMKKKIDSSDLLNILSKMKIGIIVYSGTTGSGKSHSQMQFLNHLNETQKLRIFTLEDPIEYLYTPKKSKVEQYEVGSDVPSFPKGANILANAHPDVLQISEIRDSETLAVAIEAASEMLIVAAIYASAAEDVYQRIIDNLPLDEVEDLLDDLADLPIVIVHHEGRQISEIIRLDPRS